jgi:hypothetical protein
MNWRRCLWCEESPLEVRSDERLYAFNTLTLAVSDGGELAAAEFGLSEPVWEGLTTMQYLCCGCDEQLPEHYQLALDAALKNSRQLDE